jgi:hypothetical protein
MKRARSTRLGQLALLVGIIMPTALMAQTNYSVITLDGVGGNSRRRQQHQQPRLG